MRKNTILVMLIGVIVGAMLLSAVVPLSASAADPSVLTEKGKNPPGRSSDRGNSGSPYGDDTYKNATDMAAADAVDLALAKGWITTEQAAYLKETHAPFGQLVKIIGGQNAQQIDWSYLVQEAKVELGYPNTYNDDDMYDDDMYEKDDWYKKLSDADKKAYEELFKSSQVQTALKDALIAQVNAAVTAGTLTQTQADAMIMQINKLSADGKLYLGLLGIVGYKYSDDKYDDDYKDDKHDD